MIVRLLSPRSLTWRVIAHQIALVLALLAVVAVVMTRWVDPPEPINYWFDTVSQLIRDSVVRGPDGTARLEPVPSLLAYRSSHPGLEIAAADPAAHRVLPGSDEALARDIAPLAGLKLRVIAFDRPDRGELPLQGGGLRVETALGPIVVYALGGAVTRDDRWHFAIHIANDIAHYAVPALLAIMLVAWRGVRSALAPLRAAGRQTAEINFRSAQARLPDDSRVPSELLPLMQGINRALDRLQEGFLQQQRFTANAAHELRTPLAILRARIDSLEAHADRTGLQRDAQRITSLVDQMLAIARLEQMAPSEATLDLGALAADLVVDFAPLAIDGGREIAFQPPARPVRVRGDTRALASAVGNLIDNALHAEPEGGTVTVTVTDDGMIEVADHGPGICEADRAAMFEPFWRRDEGRVGTGLGLAIVREVATLHGGSARYAENPGGGSVFCLVIPLA